MMELKTIQACLKNGAPVPQMATFNRENCDSATGELGFHSKFQISLTQIIWFCGSVPIAPHLETVQVSAQCAVLLGDAKQLPPRAVRLGATA